VAEAGSIDLRHAGDERLGKMSTYDEAFASALSPGKGGDPYDAAFQSALPSSIDAAVTSAPAVEKPVSVSAGKAINSIPRQLGLTARYALEGPANALQIVSEPVRQMVTDPISRLFGGKGGRPLGQEASRLADFIGLPSPRNADERVIGDASRLVAGTGLTLGAGGATSQLPGMAGRAGAAMSANGLQQLSGAAGAGLASGASREAGGGAVLQAVAGALGGVGGMMVPGAVNATTNLMRRAITPAMDNAQIDATLTRTLQTVDTDYSAIPETAKRALRTELRSSLQAGKELDPQAVRRMADIVSVGGTPTRGMVTLDPVQVTREQNLAKMAANSSDGTLQGLPRLQNENNTSLINSLNGLGGRSELDPTVAGRLVNSRVLGTQSGLRSAETAAWNEARNAPGYTQPIYPEALNAINKRLGDEGMMGFMSKPISEYMAAFQTGQQPFTPQAYRNLQSMLSKEMSKGGNEAAAAGMARSAMEATPMRPITNPGGRDFGNALVTPQMAGQLRGLDGQAGDAIAAVDRARAATRAAYEYEGSSPLVRSVLSDGATADPARIAKRFVIGGTADEAATVALELNPADIPTIRDALATHIKKQALSGAADEVGKVSQSRLNSAINTIGREKLSFFFSPEEMDQLTRTGRVASYMQFQPAGSAVNNSNSGALVLGRGADLLTNLSKKVPAGKLFLADPLESLNVSLSNRQAQNVLPGLLAAPQRAPYSTGLLAPGVALGGLLAAPRSP